MLMVVLMVMMPMPVVKGMVIFGIRKKRKGIRRLVNATTAKSPGASPRNTKKFHDEKTNGGFFCYR